MKARNMTAIPLADIPRDTGREYLAVIPSGTVTVTISGGEPFTLEAGQVWAPLPAPQNDIAFTGSGTLVIAGSGTVG